MSLQGVDTTSNPISLIVAKSLSSTTISAEISGPLLKKYFANTCTSEKLLSVTATCNHLETINYFGRHILLGAGQ